MKDLKYIIKRIIIGTGIAISLMCIKGNFMLQGHALQAISSWSMGAQTSVVDNTTNSVIWTTGSTVFANQGDGELLFTFSIYKVDGDSTSPNVAPRFVRAHTSGDSYVCYIGSSTLGNSTFNGGTYSAICPMHLESGGLTSVVVALQDNQQNSLSNYRVVFNGLFTWKRDTEYTLLDAINNKLNNIGNSDVINNQNNNTQNIINNQNSNTQDVINNQNSNTDKEIESQKICNNVQYNFNKQYYDSSNDINGFLQSSGNISSNQNWKVSTFIPLTANSTYTLTGTNTWLGVPNYCIYDENETLESCTLYNSSNLNFTLSFPVNKKIRISYSKEGSFNLIFKGKVCVNGNQAIVDSQQDINNSLNDTSGGEVSSSWFDEFKDSSTTPVSDLLTMPITLLQAYLNGFSANCQAMNLGSLYGTYIIIPCLNIESYLGSPLWSLIDVLFSLFMLYNIGMLCVTIYEGITSLDDDMQMLYSPQHAGAGDTRVERYGDKY